MTLSRIARLTIIGLIVFISLAYVIPLVDLAFGVRVEAATNERPTPTSKPTVTAEIDLRIAPGCLLPSWTGLCKRAATPTSNASPTVTPAPTATVTPTPTKTQETKVTPDPQAGTVSQGGTAQAPEVIGVQAPTIQPKSGPEGMLIGLLGMLPVGIWFLTRRVKYD